MVTKVVGIESGYSSSTVEVPYNDGFDFEVGSEVIFKDSEDKEEYGIIKYVNRDCADEEKVLFTSKVLRKATPNDIQKVENSIDSAKYALKKCQELAKKLGLIMGIFKAGYSFDGTRVHFIFTAEDRVDFRDLVKELAKILQKQIHLKQIGPRDKAKIIGGYGKCGRPLCCSTWLGRLESINMEMVRVQALESKGSSKLSGACGKLLCCLKYEVDAYRELRKTVPRIGSTIRLGKKVALVGQEGGTVIAVDILNQKAKVLFESGESLVISVSDIAKVLKGGGEAENVESTDGVGADVLS